MGGETEIIVIIFKALYKLFTAPYSEISPIIDRGIYLFLVLLVLKLMWKKISIVENSGVDRRAQFDQTK